MTSPGGLLAHGGTAGAVAEVAFILVPVGIFWFLARWAKRRAAAEAANGAGGAGDAGAGDAGPDPEPGP